ncbi:MAG TPA: hypothetical protein VHD36_00830 [Pirellulales bacterium]|nr:hypothetical protein [Pirellulales bacterium]
MSRLLVRSLSMALIWFVVGPHHGAAVAAPTEPSRPRASGLADAEVEAESDLPPAPLPEEEPAAASDETTSADESSGEKDSGPSDDAPDAPAPEASGAQSSETKTEGADNGESPAEETDDTGAPPPPGGTLLDKIKKAKKPVERPQPAEFHGLRVGQSTSKDADRALKKPLSVTNQKDVVRRIYRLDSGQRVEVRCLQDKVQAIVVSFELHPPYRELASEMGLDKFEPAEVVDEFGETVGMALPEAGALVVLAKGSRQRVAELVYEKIDAQAFTLRAEQRMDKDVDACQRDLDQALVVDPQCARAHWLRARLLRDAGQIDAATKASELAVKLDPRNPRYRLTAGALLADNGQFAKAIDQTKQGLALAAARPDLKACALNQLGDQIAAGPGRDFKTALPLHVQAIKLAEPLAQDRNPTVRRLAQESIIVAHLAAARNIAWGNWKKKKTMVPSWLNRAEELAREAAASENASFDMRLRVCREALAACVGMEGDLDPTPWAEKALAIAGPALEATTDAARRRQLEWDLGTALYDALQVFHTAGDAEQALKYGALAVEHLEAGSVDRQLEPVETYLLGRLYFRMGSVCALHMKDPQQAVGWFERAIPMLERPVPAAALVEGGRHGESFVSMAVSYWATGNHEEAVRLTRSGLKLMEKAVEEGVLEQDALRVPCANLATMHRFLGDDEQADAFDAMAAKPTEVQRK